MQGRIPPLGLAVLFVHTHPPSRLRCMQTSVEKTRRQHETVDKYFSSIEGAVDTVKHKAAEVCVWGGAERAAGCVRAYV